MTDAIMPQSEWPPAERSADLPADLAALERALQGGPSPSPAVRERVLAEVERALRAAERKQFWQYAAAVAALFLIALNLSFSAAANTSRPRPGPDRHKLTTLREDVERMQLDLPEEDIVRHCILLAASDELLPMGRPYGQHQPPANSQ